MKTFLLINRMVQAQKHGRFLSYMLVNKSLEIVINDASVMPEYLTVEFDF